MTAESPMKTIFFVLIFFTLTPSVQASTFLCRQWYKSNLGETYLHMTIERPDSSRGPGGYVLWMDRHIPYGIRPFPYRVTELSCTKGESLMMTAITVGGIEPIEFEYTAQKTEAEWQPGILKYFNNQGVIIGKVTLECSNHNIQNFCRSLP